MPKYKRIHLSEYRVLTIFMYLKQKIVFQNIMIKRNSTEIIYKTNRIFYLKLYVIIKYRE